MSERINPINELSRAQQGATPVKKRRYYGEFQPDSEYEELLNLLQTEPAKFDKLPLSEQIAVGHYRNQKQEFEEANKNEA